MTDVTQAEARAARGEERRDEAADLLPFIFAAAASASVFGGDLLPLLPSDIPSHLLWARLIPHLRRGY